MSTLITPEITSAAGTPVDSTQQVKTEEIETLTDTGVKTLGPSAEADANLAHLLQEYDHVDVTFDMDEYELEIDDDYFASNDMKDGEDDSYEDEDDPGTIVPLDQGRRNIPRKERKIAGGGRLPTIYEDTAEE